MVPEHLIFASIIPFPLSLCFNHHMAFIDSEASASFYKNPCVNIGPTIQDNLSISRCLFKSTKSLLPYKVTYHKFTWISLRTAIIHTFLFYSQGHCLISNLMISPLGYLIILKITVLFPYLVSPCSNYFYRHHNPTNPHCSEIIICVKFTHVSPFFK